MEFGKILNKWEQTEKDLSNGKDKHIADMFSKYLDSNPVVNKDEGEDEPPIKLVQSKKGLLRKRAEDSLDLHGKTREEASVELEAFFEESRRRGLTKVQIIHGKGIHSSGDAVLEKLCRDFIEKCSFAGQYGKEKGANGGSGATWVILRDKGSGACL
ncbi:MAG: Smr/MutS family protein [Spirochaetaceae bacterium]|jgi:DNA-nicking Smr family endonuclease|nr:Smr/MutS family protein [Spirochaetaceae bacterium]